MNLLKPPDRYFRRCKGNWKRCYRLGMNAFMLSAGIPPDGIGRGFDHSGCHEKRTGPIGLRTFCKRHTRGSWVQNFLETETSHTGSLRRSSIVRCRPSMMSAAAILLSVGAMER